MSTDPPHAPARSLIARLRQRADQEPGRIALRFIGERTDDETRVDCATLDRQARALAVHMVARGAAGKRVLVLHAPGLDYIVSLFACL